MEECPRRVRAALRTVPAAYEVGFDLDRDEVYVSYDAAAGEARVATAAMVVAVKRAGFNPWFDRVGWPERVDATPLPR
jgi:copper chaperone CopZ